MDAAPLKIICPSYRRAGKVVTRRWWPQVTLAVHEFEAEEYRAKEGGDILVLSDKSRGNSSNYRNEVLEAMAGEPWFAFIDDDVSDLSQFGSRSAPYRAKALSLEQIAIIIENGCEMADDMGCHLWGFNLQYDPKFYREYSPFSFQSPVLAPFCLIKPSELRYDPRVSLNDDFDFFLQNLRKDRRVLRFNRLHYTTGHLERAGGCAAYRTTDEEVRQSKVMIKKWGSKIVSYELNRSFNPRLRSPIPGL